jgi:hypothetical protein
MFTIVTISIVIAFSLFHIPPLFLLSPQFIYEFISIYYLGINLFSVLKYPPDFIGTDKEEVEAERILKNK